ncbi:MAG: starch-binding protein, partial [Defluviitaleaceae bacterium]|nr:starch-binding protein [Defluviitaleaceae bacterium]
MKKIKFLLLAVIMVLLAMFIAPNTTVNASEELGQSIVFVQVPDEWETPRIWAWGPRGNAAAADWPGELYLTPDPGNPGWHYIWLPADKTGGLINEGGGAQTADFPLTGEPVWVTVTNASGEFTVSTTPQTTGALPSATTVIFAQIPEGWSNPRVWAWGPRGNAAATDWPGELYMYHVPGNEGWYFFHLPADKTGALINEAGGSQTSDFPLDGRPVWVTISDDGSFEATNTQQTTGAIPQMYTIIYAQIPDGWERPAVWAWGPRGNAAATDWPGELTMEADPNNPGWYYVYIPTDKTGGLINGVGIQTSDFPLEGRPVWVTVEADGSFEVTATKQTAGAFAPFVPRATAAVEEGSVVMDAVVIYAQVPENWEEPALWAWGPRGNASATDWPGDIRFTPDANNPGWYYTFLPADKTGALINANEGTIQTSDFRFEGVPVWITVHNDDGDFDITTEQQTSGALQARDPFVFGAEPEVEIPDADMITLRAFVPGDWESPSVWAWTDGIGNAFRGASWPGQEFTEKEGDWYVMQIPGWIENIIIAANGGSVQMRPDPEVEPGRDVWIIVSTEFAWEVLYASV